MLELITHMFLEVAYLEMPKQAAELLYNGMPIAKRL